MSASSADKAVIMSRTQRLIVVLLLNLALVAALVVVGLTARSLAVFAAGGDYLLDAAAIGVALLAIRLSTRQAGHRRTSNQLTPTDIAALINGGWLLILELGVAATATDRLITGTPHVAGLPVLIVSAVAALIMAIGALILRKDQVDRPPEDRDLSVAAVLLDTVADATAAAGVAAAGGIILAARGWYWLDPAVALAIAIAFTWQAFALIIKIVSQRRTRAADQAR
jgi:cobalt-zinc-cadmium efflux system protein